MTVLKRPSVANLLIRQLNSTKRKPDPKITDPFAQAVAQRLETRRIATVPGARPDQPEPQWYDHVIELDRRHREFEAERERRRQAEDAVKDQPRTSASALAAAIAAQANSSHSSAIPLNGAAVLRAALGGMPGTIDSAIGQ